MSFAVNSLLKPPISTCDACSVPMTHLADLSSIGLHEAVRCAGHRTGVLRQALTKAPQSLRAARVGH